MTREARNNILTDVFVDDIGETVNTGETKVIYPTKYAHWAASVDVDGYIDAGDITIIHNGVDLNAEDAKCLIHEMTDYTKSIKTFPSVTELLRQTKAVRYLGPFFDLAVSGNTLDVGLQLSNSAEGKEEQLHFFNDGGNISNVWLDTGGNNIPSNGTPNVLAHNCKLRELTYTNSQDSSDIDIEVYLNGVLFYTFPIRDTRYAWKTNGLGALAFSIGDRISVFIRRVQPGDRPSRVLFKMTFVNTDDILSEGSFPTL